MTLARRDRFRAIGIAAGAALLVAILGGAATDLGPWYQALTLPAWQPPGPVFPIVWTLIYALTATSAVLAWRSAADEKTRLAIIGMFCLNGALNVTWSILFFDLKRPDWALVEVIPFFASILVLIVFLWPRHRLASFLLLPYVAWVSVAAALNWEVVRLNAPFGGA